jgi:putative membrane protein
MAPENRGLLVVLAVLVLFVLVMPLLGGGMMGPGMMWGPGAQGMPWTGGGWGWGLAMALGMLSMLAFWGALIVCVVLLVRWLAGTTAGPAGRTGESALDVLKRRYAAGEITREEYEQMRQTLER